MNHKTLLIDYSNKVLTITLNRPELRNAFNDELIAELTLVFKKEIKQINPRVILIKGNGKAFSAGGDLNWMQKCSGYSKKQNASDAKKLSQLLEAMNTCPYPLVGQVHGACLGGGMGLASVCDYVVATKETLFGFTEARLGLIPATIGPFCIAKIGESYARAYFLSAERFNAERAYQMGLVHQVVENEEILSASVQTLLADILELSPQALKTAKNFIRDIQNKKGIAKHNYAAQTLANLRASPEGQEGIKAFLEKRKANW